MVDYAENPKLSAEQQAILRRRKLAELIQAQSLQPIDLPQAGRGFVRPIGGLESLGKLGQAYLGRTGVDEANTADLGLAQKAQTAEQEAMANYIKSRSPMAAIPQPETGGPGRPEMARPQTELDAANIEAQVSPYKRLQVSGALNARLDEQAKNDARDAKIRAEQAQLAAEAKAEAARLAAEQRANENRKHEEFLSVLAKDKITSQEKIAGTKQTAAEEKIQAKKDAELEKKTKSAELATKSFDDLIFKIDQLVDENGNPREGFTDAFGQWDAMYPNWMKSDNTSKAYKTLESIQAQETMRGLSDAKAQVGQSFGSMQVKEWDKFTNLVRSLDPAQPDKKSLLPNLIQLRKEAVAEKAKLLGLAAQPDEVQDQQKPPLTGLSPAGQSAYDKYRRK